MSSAESAVRRLESDLDWAKRKLRDAERARDEARREVDRQRFRR